MINKQTVTSMTLAFILSGCAIFSSRVEIPKWYLKLPVKKGFVYTVGTEKVIKLRMPSLKQPRLQQRNLDLKWKWK